MKLMLKRSVDELPVIVAATERFFAESRIDQSIRMPVDLSIEELFVNMVTYNLDTDHDVLLELEPVANGVQASLTDYDVEPFDPSSHTPDVNVDASLDQREPGGLGLYLVSKMVDSVHYEYRNRESRVTFVKTAGPSHD
ncbi:MAG: ATP-binding protein [Rhodanobacteraceae bacterium]